MKIKVIIYNLVLDLLEFLDHNNKKNEITIILKPKFGNIKENETKIYNYYVKIKEIINSDFDLDNNTNNDDKNKNDFIIKKRKLILIDDMIENNISKSEMNELLDIQNEDINFSLYGELAYLENLFADIYYVPINCLNKYDKFYNLNTATKVIVPNRQITQDNSIIEIFNNNFLISYETYFEWDYIGIFSSTEDLSLKYYEDLQINIFQRVKSLLEFLNFQDQIGSIPIHLILNFEFDKYENFINQFSLRKNFSNFNKSKLKKYFNANLDKIYNFKEDNSKEMLLRLLLLKIEYEDFCLILSKSLRKKLNIKISVINSNINDFIYKVIKDSVFLNNEDEDKEEIFELKHSIKESEKNEMIEEKQINVDFNLCSNNVFSFPNKNSLNIQIEKKLKLKEFDFKKDIIFQDNINKNNSVESIFERLLKIEFIKYSYNKGSPSIFISNFSFSRDIKVSNKSKSTQSEKLNELNESNYLKELINLTFENEKYSSISIEKLI